jgi:signal transduction histidine kinase
MARVEVADDGPGVAPADREKLFLPYYSTKLRGSGLGLAIVQRVVSEHRGRIRVEENEPRGARFIVELPLESARDSAAVAAPTARGSKEI